MPARHKQFRLRPAAQADLENIWLYTAERWSPEQADIYHHRIVEVMTALADGRLQGRSAEHIRSGYFNYPAGSHLVFFKKADYGIDVVRVLHQRMAFEQNI